ncbi:MAG: hypothetical protein HY998_04100 [candidate division NC10 bacterium]|nr:hypothetical protein [candidate division NC10 bacterium]
MSSQALALNVRVREVRRSSLDREVIFIYEVENASVDRVRFHRVEAHFLDEKGRRVELLRPHLDLNPMRPGDVAFLRMKAGTDVLPLTAEIRLRFYAYEDPSVPVLQPPIKTLDFEFPAKGGQGPAPRQGAGVGLKLRGLGLVESPTNPRVLLLYALRNDGTETLQHITLEFRYLAYDRLLDIHTHPPLSYPLKRGEEAYVHVWISKEKASMIKRTEVRAIYFEQGDSSPLYVRREVDLSPEKAGAGRDGDQGFREIRWESPSDL